MQHFSGTVETGDTNTLVSEKVCYYDQYKILQ